MESDPRLNPDRTPTAGERLLAAIRDLDRGAVADDANACPAIWRDADCVLVVSELLGVDVQMVTAERDAANVHLDDEVLVLDTTGAGHHQLVTLDVWGLSMELRSMLGQDGSIWT